MEKEKAEEILQLKKKRKEVVGERRVLELEIQRLNQSKKKYTDRMRELDIDLTKLNKEIQQKKKEYVGK